MTPCTRVVCTSDIDAMKSVLEGGDVYHKRSGIHGTADCYGNRRTLPVPRVSVKEVLIGRQRSGRRLNGEFIEDA